MNAANLVQFEMVAVPINRIISGLNTPIWHKRTNVDKDCILGWLSWILATSHCTWETLETLKTILSVISESQPPVCMFKVTSPHSHVVVMMCDDSPPLLVVCCFYCMLLFPFSYSDSKLSSNWNANSKIPVQGGIKWLINCNGALTNHCNYLEKF